MSIVLGYVAMFAAASVVNKHLKMLALGVDPWCRQTWRDGVLVEIKVALAALAVTAALALVMLRMETDPALAPHTAYLTEIFVEDMDGQLRQSGVGDLVVGKKIGKLMSTLGGRLGALIPLTTRADADFAASLEMHARLAAPPLAGRDHLAYRSAYYPVRHVVDGDLCEAYGALPAEARARIAGELERAPGEVVRKLEDVRARVL